MTTRILCSGGAARGAVQVAPLRALWSRYGFDVEVDGTSTGAVSAVAYASGQLDALEQLYATLDRFQRLRPPWLWLSGMYELTPLRRVLLEQLTGRELRCPAYAHVVDVAARRYERVQLHDRPIAFVVDAVIASCSQPAPVHAPAYLGGRRKTDGGAWHPMPVVEPDAGDQVWALSCAPLSWGLLEQDQEEIGVWDSVRVMIEGDHEDDLQRLRRQAGTAEVVLVEPRQDPGPPMDFSPAWRARRLHEIGPQAWASRRTL